MILLMHNNIVELLVNELWNINVLHVSYYLYVDGIILIAADLAQAQIMLEP